VTGAGNGIGRAIALGMAAEGARLVVNDLGGSWQGDGADEGPASKTAVEIQAAGGRAIANAGDVADTANGTAMVQAAVNEYGRLDAVVNCAGILRDKMIFSMTDDDWDLVHRVHLRGHFAVTRAACAYWRQASKAAAGPVSGRVVCFASDAGLYGNLGQTNYAAAKAGIISFSTAVAREMGRYGVTSNAIAPRARTRLVESTVGGLLPDVPDGGWYSWSPDNVVPAVNYLASERGGRYSGQILVVGGGVVQVIDPFHVAAELRMDGRAPTPDEIEAFLESVRGTEAGPAPFPVPIEVDQITR
jgi:3-oxoacyl-[acyl-carrier protein] reductase